MVKPVEEVLISVHISFGGGTSLRAAAGDGLHPIPHLSDVVLKLQFLSVLLIRLPELDSEFTLHPLKLLPVAIFEGPLLLVLAALDVTCNPGLVVRMAVYSP